MSTSPFVEAIGKQLDSLLVRSNGAGDFRSEAWARFVELGLPTRKSEEWKYTPIITFLKPDVRPRTVREDAPFIGRGIVPELKDIACYFVNGFARFEGDSRVSPTVQSNDAITNPSQDPFVELNRALATDGVRINIGDNEQSKLIYVPFVTSTEGIAGKWIDSYRNRITVGDNASARIIVHQIHQDAVAENMTNLVTGVTIGDNSSVELYLVQNLRSDAIQLNHTEVVLGSSTTFTTHTVNWGSRLTRNSLNIRLTGEGSEAHLYGLYNLNGRHHLDNRTVMDHAVPNCVSNERYKGILDDHATSVFNGKIIVRPDAQKTNAFQSNPNILLSNDATINSKPQLEIFADDVKCTHGATVGHLDEDALFYLRSRGLGYNDARHLLIQAFAEEVIGRISVEPLRMFLSNQLHAELQIP